MTRQVVGVEKTVLRWARETAGLTPKAVAAMLKRDVAEVLGWEAGTAAPTYAQLEKLAYVAYKRPLAAFFLPSPPVPRHTRRLAPRRRLAPVGSRVRVVRLDTESGHEYRPDRVSPPGDSLRSLLVERRISQAELALRMCRRVQEIKAIIKGVGVIDPQTAAELEAALGAPAEFWLSRERRYRKFLAERRSTSESRA